jgi:hypothetical protein
MTDISTNAPITIRHPKLPGLSVPRFGALLAAIPGSMRDAFTMAYMAPYSSARPPRIVPGDDLEGRDPTW